MSQTLVLDIETASLWSELDDDQRAHLARLFDKRRDPPPGETAESQCALHPQTGKVVAVGLWDVEARRGVCYFDASTTRGCDRVVSLPHGDLVPLPDERTLLDRMWFDLGRASRLVTWRGHHFDNGFVVARSVFTGAQRGRELAPKWYDRKVALDLYEELSINGHFRPYSLDFTCRQLGIPTPKSDLTGAEVPAAYERGEGVRIAEYCLGDVRATAAVYELLAPRLAGGRNYGT